MDEDGAMSASEDERKMSSNVQYGEAVKRKKVSKR
jgi:hypothetical protein